VGKLPRRRYRRRRKEQRGGASWSVPHKRRRCDPGYVLSHHEWNRHRRHGPLGMGFVGLDGVSPHPIEKQRGSGNRVANILCVKLFVFVRFPFRPVSGTGDETLRKLVCLGRTNIVELTPVMVEPVGIAGGGRESWRGWRWRSRIRRACLTCGRIATPDVRLSTPCLLYCYPTAIKSRRKNEKRS
jgi:hypothetical protein